MKKAPAAFAAVLMALLLCSCSEIKLVHALPDDVLVQIDEETTSCAEGVFCLMELLDAYSDDIDDTFFERSVGDISMDEYLKECAMEEIVALTCIGFIADDLAVYLTDEEIAAAQQEADEAYADISAKYDTASYDVTQDTVRDYYEKKALYEKVYSELTDSVTMQISETDTKVIEVNFVLFPEDTDIDEAESFRTLISEGADFEEACTQAGYEPYMNITVKKGDMVSAFENVAFSLNDGELSECVETLDGIYLIECVEDYMDAESAANYNSVITAAKDEIFDDTYSEFYESSEIRTNSDYWDTISAAEL